MRGKVQWKGDERKNTGRVTTWKSSERGNADPAVLRHKC